MTSQRDSGRGQLRFPPFVYLATSVMILVEVILLVAGQIRPFFVALGIMAIAWGLVLIIQRLHTGRWW